MHAKLAHLALAASLAALSAHAAPPPEYVARVAQNYRAEIQSFDANRDGVLTRAEAQGSNLLLPVFDSIDTNRDGMLTHDEIERFLANIPVSAL